MPDWRPALVALVPGARDRAELAPPRASEARGRPRAPARRARARSRARAAALAAARARGRRGAHRRAISRPARRSSTRDGPRLASRTASSTSTTSGCRSTAPSIRRCTSWCSLAAFGFTLVARARRGVSPPGRGDRSCSWSARAGPRRCSSDGHDLLRGAAILAAALAPARGPSPGRRPHVPPRRPRRRVLVAARSRRRRSRPWRRASSSLADVGSLHAPDARRRSRLRLGRELRRLSLAAKDDHGAEGQGAAALALLARDDARPVHRHALGRALSPTQSASSTGGSISRRRTRWRRPRRATPRTGASRRSRSSRCGQPPRRAERAGRLRRRSSAARGSGRAASARSRARWRKATAIRPGATRRTRRRRSSRRRSRATRTRCCPTSRSSPASTRRRRSGRPDAPRRWRGSSRSYPRLPRRSYAQGSAASPGARAARTRPRSRSSRGCARRGGFTLHESPAALAGPRRSSTSSSRTKRGYCQHFAGAMALMLRYLGIPARVAVGLRRAARTTQGADAGRSPTTTRTPGSRCGSAGYGWLPFDPTPGRGLALGAATRSRRRGFVPQRGGIVGRVAGVAAEHGGDPPGPELRRQGHGAASSARTSGARGRPAARSASSSAAAASASCSRSLLALVRRARSLRRRRFAAHALRDARPAAAGAPRAGAELRDFLADQGIRRRAERDAARARRARAATSSTSMRTRSSPLRTRRALRSARRRRRRPRASARGAAPASARDAQAARDPRRGARARLAALARLRRMNAVVMAAGEGTRLRPITERWPKPVLPIDGRPVSRRSCAS